MISERTSTTQQTLTPIRAVNYDLRFEVRLGDELRQLRGVFPRQRAGFNYETRNH